MRKTQEELQDLMIKNNVTTLWSWSKYNTYLTDPYSYLLKYVLKIPEDTNGNAYSFLGGFIHEVLEEFYNGNITNDEMVSLFKDKIFEQQLMDIRFASDEEKNSSIGDGYIETITHFLYNYVKDENAKLESCVHIKIGDYLFYGYIDKVHIENGILFIDDFKTSTIYKGEKINKEKGQLLLYTLAINKMLNIPLEKIKSRWNFAKYVHIDCEQVNGKITTTSSKRNVIVETLQAKLKIWCKKFGYTMEQFEYWFEEANKLNKINFVDYECLSPFPKEVREKFVIRDCLVEIDISDEEIEDFLKQVKETCDEIVEKENQYAILRDNKLFWVDIDNKNSFFFTNLCGYSAKYHEPLKQYLENLVFINTDDSIGKKQSDADSDFLSALLGD